MTARASGGADQTVRSSFVAPFPSVRPLSDLLSDLPNHEVRGDPATRVEALCYRSDEAGRGSLFFCVPGDHADGHDFAEDAVGRGAVALVVERVLPFAAAQVLVPSVRAAMGPISAAFYGRPAERMTIVGITGTNGKTTTTYLLESVFRAAGWTPGVIGTTGVRIDGRPVAVPADDAGSARPSATACRDGGRRASRRWRWRCPPTACDQHRVGGVRFPVAVFTNLSQDHLDYHPSMEEYFEAKARLFTPEVSDRAVVNRDSAEGRRLIGRIPTITYGIEPGADVQANDVEATARGIDFRVDGVRVHSSLRGLFNVENCLAAFATARVLGIAEDVAADAIGSVEGVPGRVEAVEAGQGFLVLVDYAHTPDSVENVLRAARRLSTGRLIVVLGCGGDRDRAKRPLMGRAATSNADLAVITSDNPRSEDPAAIIAEIEPGARAGGGAYVIEPDRRSAIRLAIAEAGPADVIVIAGKGHEPYQEFADRTIPFDDRAVAAEELRALQEAGT